MLKYFVIFLLSSSYDIMAAVNIVAGEAAANRVAGEATAEARDRVKECNDNSKQSMELDIPTE